MHKFTLIDVRDSPMEPPDWAAVVGEWVNDARLNYSDLNSRVSYKLRDKLPALAEVQKLKEQDATKRTSTPHRLQWWHLIPGLLLILIGAVWYWRLRAKKVA